MAVAGGAKAAMADMAGKISSHGLRARRVPLLRIRYLSLHFFFSFFFVHFLCSYIETKFSVPRLSDFRISRVWRDVIESKKRHNKNVLQLCVIVRSLCNRF